MLVIKSNFSKDMAKEEIIKVFSEDEYLKTLERVDKELLMPKIKFSQSMLFPSEDNKINKWAIDDKTGGEDYMLPLYWIKYGINIDHCFNERSPDWICDENKANQWAVAYCGIGITETLKQIYENDDDIRHRNRKVGVGLYVVVNSNHNELRPYGILIKKI